MYLIGDDCGGWFDLCFRGELFIDFLILWLAAVAVCVYIVIFIFSLTFDILILILSSTNTYFLVGRV